MARSGLEKRTSPDRRERPVQSRTRAIVFAFVVILSSIVFGVVLVAGPVTDAAGPGRLEALVIVPLLIGLALLATLIWFAVQSRRGRRR